MTHRELGERPIENGGVSSLPIGDGIITQIQIDHAFGMHVDVDTAIRFETPFQWFDGADETTIDPEVSDQLGPLLQLIHTAVAKVTIVEDGSHLLVELEGGQWLKSSAHDQYEAWTATTSWGIPEQRAFYVATTGR